MGQVPGPDATGGTRQRSLPSVSKAERTLLRRGRASHRASSAGVHLTAVRPARKLPETVSAAGTRGGGRVGAARGGVERQATPGRGRGGRGSGWGGLRFGMAPALLTRAPSGRPESGRRASARERWGRAGETRRVEPGGPAGGVTCVRESWAAAAMVFPSCTGGEGRTGGRRPGREGGGGTGRRRGQRPGVSPNFDNFPLHAAPPRPAPPRPAGPTGRGGVQSPARESEARNQALTPAALENPVRMEHRDGPEAEAAPWRPEREI